jgi:hypothetical protein
MTPRRRALLQASAHAGPWPLAAPLCQDTGSAPQLHLHVARLVLGSSADVGNNSAALSMALRQAVVAQLRGELPAVNQAQLVDHIASAVVPQVRPATARVGPV